MKFTGNFPVILLWYNLPVSYSQGCALGLDVSVSRRSRDVLTSRLGLDAIRLVSGLGPFRLVETFCAVRPMKPV